MLYGNAPFFQDAERNAAHFGKFKTVYFMYFGPGVEETWKFEKYSVFASDQVFALELLDVSVSHDCYSVPQYFACRRTGSVKLEPLETQKMQNFVKEGNRLRVLRVGCPEVLRAVLSLSDDSYATCGSRLLQMSNTAVTEGVTSGCTIDVWERLRGGARMGGTGSGYILGQWQCLVCAADRCWPARSRCYRCSQPRGTLHQVH